MRLSPEMGGSFFKTKKKGGKITHKAAHSLRHVNLKLFQPPTIFFIPNTFVTVVSFAYPLDETYTFFFSKDIYPPPPKA